MNTTQVRFTKGNSWVLCNIIDNITYVFIASNNQTYKCDYSKAMNIFTDLVNKGWTKTIINQG